MPLPDRPVSLHPFPQPFPHTICPIICASPSFFIKYLPFSPFSEFLPLFPFSTEEQTFINTLFSCETRGKLCSLALHLQDCCAVLYCTVHSTLDSIKTQTILGLSFIFTTFTCSSALFVFSSIIIIACITPSLIHLSRISTSRQPSPTTPSFPVSTNTSSQNADQIPSIQKH